MNNLLHKIEATWDRAEGASPEDIGDTERTLKVRFPADYCTFVEWSNGGHGLIGKTRLALWELDELEQLNSDYQISSYLPGVFGIGTDGGGECYALDFRKSRDMPALIQVPLGDLRKESITALAPSFLKWLEDLLKENEDLENLP